MEFGMTPEIFNNLASNSVILLLASHVTRLSEQHAFIFEALLSIESHSLTTRQSDSHFGADA
jgi:hypothetical protein